jgi:lysophospholipase L1-like esterase
MQRTRRVPRTALGGLVLAGLALGLVGAELLARRAFPPPRVPYVWPPRLERTFRPTPEVMPGVSGPSLFRTSSLGLRGDEPSPDAFPRVIALGGSTTECLYLDQQEAWPQRLQQLLRETAPGTWVGNAGRSGHSTREHVLQVEALAGREPRPHLVLLMAGVNDLGKRLAQDEAYDPQALDRPGERARLAPVAFSVLPDGAGSNLPWFKQTALWRLASHLRARYTEDPRVQKTTGEIYLEWRRRRREASALRDELPDLTSALEEFRRNLATCVRQARAAGAEVVLLDQPALWREDLPSELDARLWMGGVGEYSSTDGCEYYTPGALARGLARYNAAVHEVAAEQGVASIALGEALPRDGTIFYDDVHFTEQGARRVARLVADALVSRRLLPSPPAAEDPPR